MSAALRVQPSQAFSELPRNFVPPQAPRAPRAAGLRVVAAIEELLTVAEVAKVLKVSTATVYALVDRGDVAHVRVSNAIRVTRAALERYVGGL